MKLLVITCWTGGPPFAKMTSKMLADLVVSLKDTDLDGWRISLVAQGAKMDATVLLPPGTSEQFTLTQLGKNGGFAVGMNEALKAGLRQMREPDAVLCLNNDMEFHQTSWLTELLKELEDNVVLCPKTNYTSVNEQRASAAQDKDPIYHGVTPGLCWLMPWSVVQEVRMHQGMDGKLFPDDLGGLAWGEDNYTAAVWRAKLASPTPRRPFKIVARSWVKHLGAKTSSRVPDDEKMRCHREAHRRIKAEGL